MKRLSFESPSVLLAVGGLLGLLLGVADSSTTSTPTTKPNNEVTLSAPGNVGTVRQVHQTETSITLQWDKVDNITTYELHIDSINKNESISASNNGSSVEFVVSDLTAGTLYNLILFTVDGELKSNGTSFQAWTAPTNVQNVTVVTQNETSILLEWERVDNISTYILKYENNETNIIESTDPIRTVVSDLTAGTRYSFTLFTVFENVNSSGFMFDGVTAPANVQNVTVVYQNETSIVLEWERVDNISIYILKYENTEINITESTDPIRTVVSNLTAGTRYFFTLFTVFENVNSRGFMFDGVTAPRNTKTLKPAGQNETSITLEWEKVDGISSYNVAFDEEELTIDPSMVSHTISNLTSGTKYNFTFFTKFENISSNKVHLMAVTAPRNVHNVAAVSQTETSITLQWAKVEDSFNYTLTSDGTPNSEITNDESESELVVHTVSPLNPGRKYTFTLFTVFEYALSSGQTFTASTVPPVVDGVSVTDRSLTSITLQWKNANNNWKYKIEIDNCDNNCVAEPNVITSDVVTHTVPDLKAGTKFTFRVITVFEHESKPFEVVTLTVIDCNSVPWQITSTSIQATVVGEFTKATIKDLSGSVIFTNQNVFFTGLSPGETYDITLEYETIQEPLLQCKHGLTLPPSDAVGSCEYEASGYSIRIVWNQPLGVCTEAEVNVSGNHHVSECNKRYMVIPGFEPAKTYQVSLGLLSGEVRSQEPSIFDCSTDPRGVIAGSVMAVLIFIILVCVVLFIVFKRPDLIRRNKRSIGGSKRSMTNSKVISLSMFPSHFYDLSLDENRGFRQEYESLGPVGREQKQNAAELQENASRNRFTNVLPYDWNRVKLTTSDSFESTDYINASYMPGYKSNKEFIATQGPLPSTLYDFWRMIWEQQATGIAMVTNCTELRQTKCEQYWPSNGQSCTFKEFTVTTVSEQQLPNWTLRKFNVKNRNTSEERTVRHFHFTAWPDHGVPKSTDVLIQFRGLVREHIERDGGRAPTVVHCSAGVGRTGTLIALDALLQQLEKEQAVGINAFVHRMRLNRPYMVQTESQYIFLHQCILDSLQSKGKTDDNIYENTVDTIYINATALQDLRQRN